MRLPTKKWTHYAVGAKTREQAIENMYNEYDRHCGRRRKPAREAVEVYRTVHHQGIVWILYVRVRAGQGRSA